MGATMLSVTHEQEERLKHHLSLVIEENRQTNITRIDTWEQGWLLHVEDSLAGVPELEAAPGGPLADLGSGAGFPGIPLAIMSGRDTTLVESVGKKAAILERCAEKLGMSNQVHVYPGRAESLARERRNAFSVITARALSSLPSLMELASPLLALGGHLICYKAGNIEEELQTALPLQEKLGMVFEKKRSFMLSDGQTSRTIVVFKKAHDAQVKLPRREGQAQRKPYKA